MRKKDVNNVTQLDTYYNEARKIKFADDVEVGSVRDIKKLLFEIELPTFYTRNGHHCEKGRYRSFNDYYLLCKYYFPHETMKYFTQVLVNDEKYNLEKKNSMIYLRYCPNIRKHNSGGRHSYKYHKNNQIPNCLKKPLIFGFSSKFSFEEIMNN